MCKAVSIQLLTHPLPTPPLLHHQGSPLLSQVAPTGRAHFNITRNSVFDGNYAYMDGGVISIAAEQRGNAIDAVSNAPQIQLSVSSC